MTLAASLLPWLMPLLLVYARIQACLLAMPGLGERMIPVRIRVAAAMALTPLYAGAARPEPLPAPLQLAALVAAEIVAGLALGLMVRVVAMALDVASTALAQSASMSAMLGISEDMPPHPIGNLVHLAGLAVLMALGLPILLVQLMADSLAIWPPGGWPDADGLAAEAIRLVARSFWIAMLLAAPFTLGGFMFQALSGVINRVMPALPVIFIGSPAAIMLALAALAMLAPVLIALWADAILGHVLPGAP